MDLYCRLFRHNHKKKIVVNLFFKLHYDGIIIGLSTRFVQKNVNHKHNCIMIKLLWNYQQDLLRKKIPIMSMWRMNVSYPWHVFDK